MYSTVLQRLGPEVYELRKRGLDLYKAALHSSYFLHQSHCFPLFFQPLFLFLTTYLQVVCKYSIATFPSPTVYKYQGNSFLWFRNFTCKGLVKIWSFQPWAHFLGFLWFWLQGVVNYACSKLIYLMFLEGEDEICIGDRWSGEWAWERCHC